MHTKYVVNKKTIYNKYDRRDKKSTTKPVCGTSLAL